MKLAIVPAGDQWMVVNHPSGFPMSEVCCLEDATEIVKGYDAPPPPAIEIKDGGVRPEVPALEKGWNTTHDGAGKVYVGKSEMILISRGAAAHLRGMDSKAWHGPVKIK